MSKKSEKDRFELKISPEIEQYERKIYDLKQLIEISKGLNSTLDYNVLIDSILLTCMGQMQLMKAGIFTKKEISRDVYVLNRNYKGFELNHSIEYGIKPDSLLMKFLEDNFRCYELKEIIDRVEDELSLKTLKIIEPDLIVPLKGKGELNGIIILGSRINVERFSESEKQFLLDIASLAGIAIQNAYLYEMATTDMMTKLKIHHFFQAALIDERERSLNNNKPLSVIMIDVDHFKDFNDTYGHTCGDLILMNVARLIMESTRQRDVSARYGGEEFGIILPNTALTEAIEVARRIRVSVENSRINCNDKRLGVTISLGVAQLSPDKDSNSRSLIERADRALYKSKIDGRNMVSFLS
jgi:two-component system cell cycle response regulator